MNFNACRTFRLVYKAPFIRDVTRQCRLSVKGGCDYVYPELKSRGHFHRE
jgi:hypothetical protein